MTAFEPAAVGDLLWGSGSENDLGGSVLLQCGRSAKRMML
jgi:hypothetical protein